MPWVEIFALRSNPKHCLKSVVLAGARTVHPYDFPTNVSTLIENGSTLEIPKHKLPGIFFSAAILIKKIGIPLDLPVGGYPIM